MVSAPAKVFASWITTPSVHPPRRGADIVVVRSVEREADARQSRKRNDT